MRTQTTQFHLCLSPYLSLPHFVYLQRRDKVWLHNLHGVLSQRGLLTLSPNALRQGGSLGQISERTYRIDAIHQTQGE